jgi:hypothetical protein
LTLNTLQIIDLTQYPGWDELLLSCPDYSFFDSSAWARVLAESYGYTPLYFTVLETGKLRALVPVMEVKSILTGTRGVSLPFTDYCEPIIGDGVEFSDLFNSMVEYGRKRGWKYIELRGGEKYFSSLNPPTSSLQPRASNLEPQTSCLVPQASTLEPRAPNLNPRTSRSALCSMRSAPLPSTSGLQPSTSNIQPSTSSLIPVFASYLVHKLDLSLKEGEIFSKFRNSTRRNIKRAQAEGVRTQISTSLDFVDCFYKLNSLTRKRHGLPPQPYSFFRNLHEMVLSRDMGFIVLAFLGKEAIAASVYLHFGKKAIYKFGASDIKFQRLRANNLVMWEAIKWYSENGFSTLCLGRTEPGNVGLQRFKAGWGAKQHSTCYYQYDLTGDTFLKKPQKVVMPLQNRIFSKTPIPLLEVAGNVFYKHMG